MPACPVPPRRALPLVPFLVAAAVAATAPSPAAGQPFTRVNDAAIAAHVAAQSSASWADADGDGDLDLFVTTWSAATPNVLFRNDGPAGFVRDSTAGLEATTAESFGSAWADIDGDGRIEPFVSQLFAGGGVLSRRGAAGFTTLAGAVTGAAIKGNGTWGDLDADGNVDLVLACLFGTGGITTANRLFLGDGAGGFAERDTGALAGVFDSHHTVTWADYDDDGDSDLFFAAGGVGSSKRDRLYRNLLRETGQATLAPITTGALATDFHDSQVITWADYDNDGDLDAYVLNYTTFPNMLYRNDGGGAFTRVLGVGPIVTDAGQAHGGAWGDFDNDGDLDVHVARDGNQADRLYRNAGDGTFTSLAGSEIVTLARSNWNSVAGDYDRDGDLDLFVPVRDANGPGLLYRNDLASGAHWLEVKAVGTASNRAALGARLSARVTIGGVARRLEREVSASTGYGGHSMLEVHFGLGDAVVVDTLVASWPSGRRDTLLALPVDTLLTVREGDGVVGVGGAPGATRRGALALGPTRPNPAGRGFVAWDVDARRAGPATLDLHDARGRRLARLWSGTLVEGRQRIRVSLPDDLAIGVHFARLSSRGDACTRRVIVTPTP